MRRTTPKSRGKAHVTDMTPSERPKDLPENFPIEFSWELPQKNKMVLLEIIHQGSMGYCWTISYNRMIGAHLYIHGKVRVLLRLSAKHLYAHIKEKFSNGFLKNYNGLKIFLKDDGLIREEDCKCVLVNREGEYSSLACDKVKGRKTFKILEFKVVEGKNIDETEIIRLLKTIGLIAVEIEVTQAYSTDYVDMYYGAPKNSLKYNHIVLLTKYATDSNGISYF
ncbi:PREDICTED: uncharacterized protein LOC104785767 isoform X1 [Camelina sativa]|uniref:Uncharacterized protein LOC104785767 isoform X1 n=1 Tax=Camelina sativa TaxID=90675 RepID=A0ABM0Z230_CAMSA|nr:PREDICTED: uncharacterized protein LOC104785767 isoform X1 [Camelina sativa]